MKWDMEIEEVEAVLEKVCDLHDKLSDAIHSISRTHFLNSVKSLKKSSPSSSEDAARKKPFVDFSVAGDDGARNGNNGGYVFVKDYEKDSPSSAISEAKSLTAIRTALENLEDQLEFFHTIQVQQRAERDAAIARLEQSRIILALRLAEHHGKRYKVIEEAMDFVRDVRDSSCFISPENPSSLPATAPTDHFMQQKGGIKSNLWIRILSSGLDCARSMLKLEVGGVIGNAALFAISMLTFLNLHNVAYKHSCMVDIDTQKQGRASSSRAAWIEGSSSMSVTDDMGHLDVLAARG